MADPDAVGPEWLTAVLADAAEPGARVVAVDAARIGTGKIGRNIRFRLEWSPTGAGPESVVAKFPSDDETSRSGGVAMGTYAREVAFYRSLAARLVPAVPVCHFAEMDADTGEFVIVLEDLRDARAGDQITAGTPDQAAAALEQLAGLHAEMWGLGPPYPFAGLEPAADGGAGLGGIYRALLDGFTARYGDRLPPPVFDAAGRFAPVVEAWVSGRTGPPTVVHNDYRLENLLFGPPSRPVTIVDWQTVGVGAGVSDASYFLGAGLTTDERRSHEMELLRLYHDRLVAGGVSGYSWDECLTGYRYNSLWGLWMSVVAPLVVAADARGDDMFCAMAERHAFHALDMDVFDLVSC